MINVLVMENGQLKLSDFGLAKKIRGEDDFTKSTVGTPYYLSPETLNNNRCSSKSDMWALGCLLFEICTGEKPFKGTAFGEIIKSILENTTQEIPSCYSKWISDLIKSLLDKNS
jgi:serine/threonine protein kinase